LTPTAELMRLLLGYVGFIVSADIHPQFICFKVDFCTEGVSFRELVEANLVKEDMHEQGKKSFFSSD